MELAAFILLVLLVRLIHLDHTVQTDELNHVLAARSLLADGSLQIGEDGGLYRRGWLYTYAVAGLFRIFGESLVVARLPAVIAGTALVTLLFVWLRREAGSGPAWLGGLLFGLAPISLYLSQFARFYTFQALLFLAGSLAVYSAVRPEPMARRRRLLLSAFGALALLVALELQVISIIGIAGLLFWLASVGVGRLLKRNVPARTVALAVAAGVAIGAGAATALYVVGPAARWVNLFTYSDIWADSARENTRYYHYIFLELYPTLWTLFPVALLVGALARPRAVLLSIAVFSVAFVFHSLAAWKVERYLFYAMPFFFAIWGIAGASLFIALRREGERLLRRHLSENLRPGRATARRLATAAAVLAFAFAILGNQAATYARHMLTVPDTEWALSRNYRGEPDWRAAAERLAPITDTIDVVLSVSDLEAIYYLGRLDFVLRPVRAGDGFLAEFDTLPKTRRPAIRSSDALGRIMACHPSGMIVSETKRWRRSHGVLPETANFIEKRLERVPLPEEFRLLAFTWNPAAEAAEGLALSSAVDACRAF